MVYLLPCLFLSMRSIVSGFPGNANKLCSFSRILSASAAYNTQHHTSTYNTQHHIHTHTPHSITQHTHSITSTHTTQHHIHTASHNTHTASHTTSHPHTAHHIQHTTHSITHAPTQHHTHAQTRTPSRRVLKLISLQRSVVLPTVFLLTGPGEINDICYEFILLSKCALFGGSTAPTVIHSSTPTHSTHR